MRVLFVHHRFPGQFLHWARYLSKQKGVDIRALRAGSEIDTACEVLRDITYEYEPASLSRDAESHALKRTLHATANAYNCAIAAQSLKVQGWIPDVIYCHTGWAPSIFLREIYPTAKIIKYLEWYYNSDDSDVDFLGGAQELQARFAVKIMNLPILADIVDGVALISPTEWQKRQFPEMIRSKIDIVPDGIDTDYFRPDPKARLVLKNGRVLTSADRLVTYAARGADPYRGFQSFIRAWEKLQQIDPTVEAVISGDQSVHYGAGAGTDRHFQEVMAEARLDMARTHFVGFLPLEQHLSLLQISTVHVYLTVPFVLSWSMLEAMSVGCCVIASDTAPVREFVENEKNGILVDFFDGDAICARLKAALGDGGSRKRLSHAARNTVKSRWSLDIAIRAHRLQLDSVLESAHR